MIACSWMVSRTFPRKPVLKRWVEKMFFNGVDLLDSSAPHARLVSWFRWPAFCFGLGILIPTNSIWFLTDLTVLALAIYIFYRSASGDGGFDSDQKSNSSVSPEVEDDSLAV